jgi:hypothetical protein
MYTPLPWKIYGNELTYSERKYNGITTQMDIIDRKITHIKKQYFFEDHDGKICFKGNPLYSIGPKSMLSTRINKKDSRAWEFILNYFKILMDSDNVSILYIIFTMYFF